MGKVISLNKFRKNKNIQKAGNETTESEDALTEDVADNPKTVSEKGWYFASLDESDTATILRFLGYLFGFVFCLALIPAGLTDWVQRGLIVSGFCLAVSYLLVLRKN
jgi:hypothetical protein